MSFLNIPSEEGLLFTTVKTSGRSAEEEEEDEEDTEEEGVRLLPRSSPVPRRRGRSIYDETAEYLRIQDQLPSRRVAFADTTGDRDLVDVKEFVAFDSDDEDDAARWEAEEAKYRPVHREPTYRVVPEFAVPTSAALTHAVHTDKVAVESVSPVEDEPLAFSGFVRVLNVSFDKSVYVRSTMDGWATYFDYPADYVPGSNDGETDRFSFKISFAPPYVTHGSRIEFVVRFETPEGDYWANNSRMNYVITLLLSYEDGSPQVSSCDNVAEKKSILKPPKIYSMEGVDDLEDFTDNDEEDQEIADLQLGVERPTPVPLVCPVIVPPEIDVEIAADDALRSPLPANPDLPSTDETLSSVTVSLGEQQTPYVSCTTTTSQTHEAQTVACLTIEPLQETELEPLPEQHCELDDHIQEETKESSPSTPPLAPLLFPPPSSMSQASDGEEEEEGGTPNLSHSEPDTDPDPPYTEIQLHVPSLKDLTNVWSPPTIPDVEREQVKQGSKEEEEEQGSKQEEEGQGSKEEEEGQGSKQEEEGQGSKQEEEGQGSKQEEEGQGSKQEEEGQGSKQEEEGQGSKEEEEDQGSEEEEEAQRQEAETEKVHKMSFIIQEPAISSTSRPLDRLVPDRCEHRAKIEDSPHREIPPGIIPPPPDETDTELTSKGDDDKVKEEEVLTETGPSLENSQAGGEEVPVGLAATCLWPPHKVTHHGPTGEDRSTRYSLEPHAGPTSLSAGSHQRFGREVAAELSELVAALEDDSSSSTPQQGESTAFSHTSSAGLESSAANETVPPPGFPDGTSVLAAFTEVKTSTTQDDSLSPNQDGAMSVKEGDEDKESLSVPSDQTWKRTVIPSIVLLGAAVFLTAGFHDPSVFPILALFLVLLCF